jgi:hypothetical protein
VFQNLKVSHAQDARVKNERAGVARRGYGEFDAKRRKIRVRGIKELPYYHISAIIEL